MITNNNSSLTKIPGLLDWKRQLPGYCLNQYCFSQSIITSKDVQAGDFYLSGSPNMVTSLTTNNITPVTINKQLEIIKDHC